MSPTKSLPDLIQHEALASAATTTVAADGYLLTLDWKEDERFDLIEALANQRRQKGTPSSQPACATPPRLRTGSIAGVRRKWC